MERQTVPVAGQPTTIAAAAVASRAASRARRSGVGSGSTSGCRTRGPVVEDVGTAKPSGDPAGEAEGTERGPRRRRHRRRPAAGGRDSASRTKPAGLLHHSQPQRDAASRTGQARSDGPAESAPFPIDPRHNGRPKARAVRGTGDANSFPHDCLVHFGRPLAVAPQTPRASRPSRPAGAGEPLRDVQTTDGADRVHGEEEGQEEDLGPAQSGR